LEQILEVDQKLFLLQLLCVHGVVVARNGFVKLVPVGNGRVEQELAKALNRQNVEGSLRRLDEVGEPGHRLVGALPLEDVEQKVWISTPTEEMPNFVVLEF
jgi:hypothetical protein